jgi:CDGSH-type Zn-finger protein
LLVVSGGSERFRHRSGPRHSAVYGPGGAERHLQGSGESHCQEIDGQVKAFLSRPLQESGYVYLNATYLHGQLGKALRIRENGPLATEAELRIRGEVQRSPRATLCRCGQSGNNPYCDGSHTRVNFQAD